MIESLRRAAETHAGQEQMAHHPCDLGPPLAGALHLEEVDVEVEVGLQAPRVHAREPPEVKLQPRTEVDHEFHRLEVGEVADPPPSTTRPRARSPSQERCEPHLAVMGEGRTPREARPERAPYPSGRRLAVPADDGDRLLAGVNAGRYAELLLREAPLPFPTCP